MNVENKINKNVNTVFDEKINTTMDKMAQDIQVFHNF